MGPGVDMFAARLAGLHPAVGVSAAAVAAALWMAAHAMHPARSRPGGAGRLTLQMAAGFAALFLGLAAAGRWVVLATDWPLWGLAALGAAAVEALLRLYALERSTVSRAVGGALAGLRVLLALLVVAMLAQPVLVETSKEEVKRTVAVLVDCSASMQVPDTSIETWQKVRLASLLAGGMLPERTAVEESAGLAAGAAAALADEAQWATMLKELDGPQHERHLAAHADQLLDRLSRVTTHVAETAQALADAQQRAAYLTDETRGELANVGAALSRDVLGPVEQAVATLRAGTGAGAVLPVLLAEAAEGLNRQVPLLDESSRRADADFYEALTDEQRAVLEAAVSDTRLGIARRLLDGGTDAAFAGLLPALRAQYNVRLYGFAAEAEHIADAGSLAGPGDDADALQTNIGAALERLLEEVPAERLAGALLLTDGRDNGGGRMQAVAARLAGEEVPVSSIVIGSEVAPRDAAVVSLEAAETVYAGDDVYVATELKFDGMAGEQAEVMLIREDTVVQTQTVPVPDPAFRTRIELSDSPGQMGLLTYRVRVRPVDGEVIEDNNEFPLTVSATDDRVNLLLIEGRPRWEYRYLKNLFAGRDRTVRLQQVLFRPEHIAGHDQKNVVAASVSMPDDETEATALPADEGEWLKFDVVILGDVSPAQFPLAAQEALRRFVVDRGGALVVVSGIHDMPRSFVGMTLDELLPVVADAAPPQAAEGDQAYRMTLTPEGRRSIVTRLKPSSEENAAFWPSRPPLYWRCPVRAVKPQANVLLFAQPESVPEDARSTENAGSDAAAREFQRQRPLIVIQNVGLGRTVFLAFDRTWRLRHREGDTYHHKFWGQLLRWATAGKLPVGTERVKLGTDRARYPLHSRVQVRAKLLGEDLGPVPGAEVAATLRRDGEVVLRRKLEYSGELPGLYTADLGELPSGAYTVVLGGPEVESALSADKLDELSVGFSVDPASSTEQVELSASREVPELLAESTGGIVVDAPRAVLVSGALREPTLVREDRSEYAVWSSWPLLAAILGLATVEWIVRRKAGLP